MNEILVQFFTMTLFHDKIFSTIFDMSTRFSKRIFLNNATFALMSFVILFVSAWTHWQQLKDENFKSLSDQSLLRSFRISHYISQHDPKLNSPPPDERETFAANVGESLLLVESNKVIWGSASRWDMINQDPLLLKYLESPTAQIGDIVILSDGNENFVSLQKWASFWIIKITPRHWLESANSLGLWRLILLNMGAWLILNLVYFLGIIYLTRNLSHILSKVQSLKDRAGLKIAALPQGISREVIEANDSLLSFKNELSQAQIEAKKSEAEMALTRNLQLTLLPPQTYSYENLSLSAFYMPAEFCGGDLYYYFRVDHKIIVCLGDVTGHGISSSLLTASIRGTLALIETNYPGLEKSVELLNYSTFSTSQSKKQMTFLMMEIDLKNKLIQYVNAGHEAPVVFTASQDNLNFGTEILLDTHCARLGDHKEINVKKASQFHLTSQSIIFIYTDGFIDLLGISDTRIIKTLKKDLDQGLGLEMLRTRLIEQIQRQVANRLPPDDVSFLMMNVNPPEQS